MYSQTCIFLELQFIHLMLGNSAHKPTFPTRTAHDVTSFQDPLCVKLVQFYDLLRQTMFNLEK